MENELGKLSLPRLNLPEFTPRLEERDGKFWIFDQLRRKLLVLTPEEWVRQHWIHFLIYHLHYPKGLVALEKGLKYNQLQKRTDLVVWNQDSTPYLLIECKAPKIKLTQKTIEQACLYHVKLQTNYLIISNGLQHICLVFDYEKKSFVQQTDFPPSPSSKKE